MKYTYRLRMFMHLYFCKKTQGSLNMQKCMKYSKYSTCYKIQKNINLHKYVQSSYTDSYTFRIVCLSISLELSSLIEIQIFCIKIQSIDNRFRYTFLNICIFFFIMYVTPHHHTGVTIHHVMCVLFGVLFYN